MPEALGVVHPFCVVWIVGDFGPPCRLVRTVEKNKRDGLVLDFRGPESPMLLLE